MMKCSKVKLFFILCLCIWKISYIETKNNDDTEEFARLQVHGSYSQVASNRPVFSQQLRAAPSTVQKENDDNNAIDTCLPNSTGRFPYSKDCRKYLYCMKGRRQIKSCSSGQRFNAQTNKCDFMANVKCLTPDELKKSAVEVEVAPSIPVRLDRRIAEVVDYDYDGMNSDPNTPRVECEKYASGLYAHPFDCSKYLNCANGATYIQDCGRGTVFNAQSKVCDWPRNVNCGSRPNVKAATNSDYRSRKDYSHGEGIIQPRNDFDLVVENLEAQDTSKNMLHNTHAKHAAREEVARVLVHDQYSQVASNRPKYTNHFGRSDSTFERQTALSSDGRQSRLNSLDENDIVPVGTECPPNSTGQFPYLMDCRQYLNCWKGRGYIQSCNPGTLFNPKTKECDFPAKVKCVTLNLLNQLDSHEAYQNYRTSEDVREFAPALTNRKDTFAATSRFIEADYDYDGAIIDPDTPRVECEQYASGLYEHPYDCNKFLNCANGATYIQNCGVGTVFNPLYKICDWPYNVDCSGRIPYEKPSPPTHGDFRENKSFVKAHPVLQSRSELDIAAGDLAPQKVNANYQTQNAISGSSRHEVPIYVRRSTTTTTTVRPRPVYYNRQNSAITSPKPPVSHLLPSETPSHPRSSQKLTLSSRQNSLLAQEPKQFTSTMPVNNNRNYQKAKDDNGAESHRSNDEEAAATLPISEALKLLLRPYFNRSGTVAEEVPFQLQVPAVTTEQPRSESIISKEQESLLGLNRESGEDYDGPKRQHHKKNQHSADFHRRHPEIKNPFADEKPQYPKKFQHSDEYHRRYPQKLLQTTERTTTAEYEEREFPIQPRFDENPDNNHHRHQHHHHHHRHSVSTTTEKYTATSFQSRAHAQPPAPQQPTTTPLTVYFDRDFRPFDAPLATTPPPPPDSDMFACRNGHQIELEKVCDGKDDCGNRQDEQDCEHIGYEVRLSSANGNTNEGRVEVKVYGKWGYICDDKFGMPDADVLCRELGFTMGASEIRLNSFYAANPKFNTGTGNPLFVMDEIECVGNETSLKECTFNGWGVHDCNAEEIVGVVCKLPVMSCPLDYWLCVESQECIPTGFLCDNVPDCGDGSDENPEHCNAPLEWRLTGGRTRFEGRVEVKYRGIWGTVCDDDFGAAETNVVCRSLGYNGPSSVAKNTFPPGMGQIWLDQVHCVGNESNLDSCLHWHWGEHNCGHTEDVGIRCSQAARKAVNVHSEEFHPTVIQTERSGRILPTECGIVKVNQNTREPDFHFKVVRGTKTRKGFHPWQASIRAKKQSKSAHWCGAVLISKFHLLTAAHCLVGYPKGAYIIRLGDHLSDVTEESEVEIYIENFYIHEDFRKGQHMNNDIAVVLLKSPVRFTNYIQPVCLPSKDTVYQPGKKCTISGWGATQSGSSLTSTDLHAGNIPLLAPEICQQKEVYGKYITDGMFCAGSLEENVDACDGDSGGPLVCPNEDGSNTLFGIISWGQHCGFANKPGVYVKVTHYLDWINEKLNLTFNNFGI